MGFFYVLSSFFCKMLDILFCVCVFFLSLLMIFFFLMMSFLNDF